jgi:hypothetical protein
MSIDAMKMQATQVSARTGLKEATCLDLFLSGWVFQQQRNGEPDLWVSPQGSLTIRTNQK